MGAEDPPIAPGPLPFPLRDDLAGQQVGVARGVDADLPHHLADDHLDVLVVDVHALRAFEDLRRPGAASLDLAWVACGVSDGFFELGLAPWDVAAGALLIAEAGGVVTDWDGGPGYLSGHILAGSPAVHAELATIARASGEPP